MSNECFLQCRHGVAAAHHRRQAVQNQGRQPAARRAPHQCNRRPSASGRKGDSCPQEARWKLSASDQACFRISGEQVSECSRDAMPCCWTRPPHTLMRCVFACLQGAFAKSCNLGQCEFVSTLIEGALAVRRAASQDCTMLCWWQCLWSSQTSQYQAWSTRRCR